MAVDGSNKDKEQGFTDVITSPWLYLTSSCSFNVRLSFQFNIENEQDEIEVFLTKKDETQAASVGLWPALNSRTYNSSGDIGSFWQQANVSFKAAEEFRIEIEIRHSPDERTDSTTWFAIDDILIENCPIVRTTTTRKIDPSLLATRSWPIRSYFKIDNSSLLRRSFVRFRWKFNDTSTTSSLEESLTPRFTLLSFILYILCALVGLSLLIILLAIIIFTYRKYCLPKTVSITPMIDHRHRSGSKRIPTRMGGVHNSYVDQDARTERTMVTTVRPCY
ncbi:unnamed protein product [Rotaria socialis]|uniref:MAM domain-containing protein n=2 Tax=Rotaria socialis TaxID=392032 RepID=A0A817VNV4_9BILA|nr:unnamed protein product [Rotaria socialis]CAF3370771.1 unnamed protein product [Rotaria socialis]CAF3410554.1 unnamed protein product [Rotaria socialis]CAF4132291.1 unnamed protein product [Rotaria socialis]CAF4490921.1 unnamed protein product [Rotaria socialis]